MISLHVITLGILEVLTLFNRKTCIVHCKNVFSFMKEFGLLIKVYIINEILTCFQAGCKYAN